MRIIVVIVSLCIISISWAHELFLPNRAPNKEDTSFVVTNKAVVALVNAKVIDGTGGASRSGQTIVLKEGRIFAFGDSTTKIPAGAQVINVSGGTVFPGIVGLHEHLYYTYLPKGSDLRFLPQQSWSFPRLFLACGVTTGRTAGTHEPYAELYLKKLIDSGKLMGPSLHLTAPYINGAKAEFPYHPFVGTKSIVNMVNYWADEGFTSFKLYSGVTRAQAKAAIDTAHRRGLKVTGHLWNVTFEEAARMGIDHLEHGASTSTDLNPDKKPDESVDKGSLDLITTVEAPKMKRLIQMLVQQRISITSTLANYEASQLAHDYKKYEFDPRLVDMLPPQVWESVVARRKTVAKTMGAHSERRFKLEKDFEKAFVEAGGLLAAGSDPTSYGSVIAGFANHREIELLVDAGFSTVQAIQIATLNGAKVLGVADQVGTIEVGKKADLVIVKGDLEQKISDIRNTVLVFKGGVGFDSVQIIKSLRGQVGLQ